MALSNAQLASLMRRTQKALAHFSTQHVDAARARKITDELDAACVELEARETADILTQQRTNVVARAKRGQ